MFHVTGDTYLYSYNYSALFDDSEVCACMCVCVVWPHQFADLTLQVLDAVQLPLATALGSDAVFAAAADIVDEFQLL